MCTLCDANGIVMVAVYSAIAFALSSLRSGDGGGGGMNSWCASNSNPDAGRG